MLMALLLTVPVWGASTAKKTPAEGTTAAVTSADDPPPEHPVTAEQVYEILSLTHTDVVRRQMLDDMLPYLKRMMPYLPADVMGDLQQSLGAVDYQGAMVQAFQQHLSTEDAAQMIAFYRSPAGRHMTAVMPQILEAGEQAGGTLGQQIMFQVIQRHKDEIDAAAASYRQQHPVAAPQP